MAACPKLILVSRPPHPCRELGKKNAELGHAQRAQGPDKQINSVLLQTPQYSC